MSKSKPRAFVISMSRLVVFRSGILVFALAAAAWRINESSRLREVPFATKNRPPEAAPLCPWREPGTDLTSFFPSTTRYEVETRILSGLRLELAERLGRVPSGDENALRVYPVFCAQIPLGVVLTRRVKGEFGGIELVLAVNTNQEICGLRLQRLREPMAIASALGNSHWLGSFDGKSVHCPLKLGQDIPEVPADARNSAEAIVDGVRDLLVLLAASNDAGQTQGMATSHHR